MGVTGEMLEHVAQETHSRIIATQPIRGSLPEEDYRQILRDAF